MALMMNAHKEAQDVDKEHDTEFKEAYGTSVKRGDQHYCLIIIKYLNMSQVTSENIYLLTPPDRTNMLIKGALAI